MRTKLQDLHPKKENLPYGKKLTQIQKGIKKRDSRGCRFESVPIIKLPTASAAAPTSSWYSSSFSVVGGGVGEVSDRFRDELKIGDKLDKDYEEDPVYDAHFCHYWFSPLGDAFEGDWFEGFGADIQKDDIYITVEEDSEDDQENADDDDGDTFKQELMEKKQKLMEKKQRLMEKKQKLMEKNYHLKPPEDFQERVEWSKTHCRKPIDDVWFNADVFPVPGIANLRPFGVLKAKDMAHRKVELVSTFAQGACGVYNEFFGKSYEFVEVRRWNVAYIGIYKYYYITYLVKRNKDHKEFQAKVVPSRYAKKCMVDYCRPKP